MGNSTTPSLYIYRNGSIILTPSGSSSLSGNYYSFINGTEITLNQNDSITFGRNSGGGGTYSVGSVNIFEKK